MNKLLVICGPTATGKTALAVRLAKKLDGELISADSRQVYKGLDIVTGKDFSSKETIDRLKITTPFRKKTYSLVPYRFSGVPLWLYDVVDQAEDFSVSQYQFLAKTIIIDIQKAGKLPIVVGGTGLYIKSLLEPLSSVAIPQHTKLRHALSNASVVQLQKELKRIDVGRFNTMNHSDRANPRRLVRAIEIGLYHKQRNSQGSALRIRSAYDALIIGLTASIDALEKRIYERVKKRWNQGAVSEVTKLSNVLSRSLPSATSLGIETIQAYVDSKLSKEQAIVEWTQKERAYAKRQMTWFIKQKNIHWFDVTAVDFEEEIVDIVATWYTKTYYDIENRNFV